MFLTGIVEDSNFTMKDFQTFLYLYLLLELDLLSLTITKCMTKQNHSQQLTSKSH